MLKDASAFMSALVMTYRSVKSPQIIKNKKLKFEKYKIKNLAVFPIHEYPIAGRCGLLASEVEL